VNQSGNVGATGDLTTKVIRQHKAHKAVSIKTPFGRAVLTNDKGSGITLGSDQYVSSLQAVHFASNGKIKDIMDLGSGLVTNAGVNLLANDFTWATSTLKRMAYHGVGTGTTAAAATDVFLQTPIAAGSLTGSTNGFFLGTSSLVPPNITQSVATITFSSAQSVTEWIWAMDNGATITRTSAGAAPTNNTFTDTGATFPTAGAGLAQYTIEINATVVNTPTTTKMAQILSNTATVLTIQGPSASTAWLTLANATGTAAPGATVAYAVFPTAWDHKVHASIGVSSGDSIQYTYQLTSVSGG
jgi:hypothetical protein